jgi:thiol-disulfide isomerase/thioredoxin
MNSGATSEDSLQAINAVQRFVKLDGAKNAKQQAAEESALNMLITAKVAIYKSDKKTDLVLQTIDEALKQVHPDTKFAIHFRTLRNQFTVVGTPAPELVSDRAYGSFSGLQQWKGKVIVIDFFAHWCGPCKAAFPDMEKLYAELHPKGLEIVGSSTYYGFFGDEKGLTEDQEFARMEGFVKQFGIPWPVQFGKRSNFEKYGVTAIPQVVVIDKAGIVHDLHIGYSKSLFAEFRAAIEKLLAQP